MEKNKKGTLHWLLRTLPSFYWYLYFFYSMWFLFDMKNAYLRNSFISFGSNVYKKVQKENALEARNSINLSKHLRTIRGGFSFLSVVAYLSFTNSSFFATHCTLQSTEIIKLSRTFLRNPELFLLLVPHPDTTIIDEITTTRKVGKIKETFATSIHLMRSRNADTGPALIWKDNIFEK